MYHSSEKVYEIFQNNGIFRDFLQIFLENKRIFVKGVRDFWRVIRPRFSTTPFPVQGIIAVVWSGSIQYSAVVMSTLHFQFLSSRNLKELEVLAAIVSSL